MHVKSKEIEGAQSEDSYDFDLKVADSNPNSEGPCTRSIFVTSALCSVPVSRVRH